MKWALIGASAIAARFMAPAFRAQPDGEILRIVSGSAARAAEFAKAHDIPKSGADLDEALADPAVEAVYVSSTNEKHFPQAMAAIAAGKHVLCEKPLAMSLDEAQTMVRAAKSAGLVFGTNHHLRCSGSHRAIQALIAEGRIGRVLSLRIHHAVMLPEHLQGWRIDSAGAGGGVIPDIAVHDADVARFLLGEDPESVSAQMGVSGLGKGVEDSAMSVWTTPSGVMIFTHESFTHPFAGTGLEVHGSAGSIFARGVMTQSPVGEIELVAQAGREAVPFSKHDLYVESVRRFTEAVAGRGLPAATGEDGVKSLAAALALRESARSGARLRIAYGEAS